MNMGLLLDDVKTLLVMKKTDGDMQHYLCRRILVAFHPVQCLFRGVDYKLRRVVPKEPLAHVDNGLNG